jgi:predicted ATP-dependent Lon-type protease
MSVQGMLLKVNALPERMQLAVESGAKRILIPSETSAMSRMCQTPF